MQVCTLLQTGNHASNPPLSFYKPDALPVAQPTASNTEGKAGLQEMPENYHVGLFKKRFMIVLFHMRAGEDEH